jgi:hypothetical protein
MILCFPCRLLGTCSEGLSWGVGSLDKKGRQLCSEHEPRGS